MVLTPSFVGNSIIWWRVDGTALIQCIHSQSNKALYLMSPSITWYLTFWDALTMLTGRVISPFFVSLAILNLLRTRVGDTIWSSSLSCSITLDLILLGELLGSMGTSFIWNELTRKDITSALLWGWDKVWESSLLNVRASSGTYPWVSFSLVMDIFVILITYSWRVSTPPNIMWIICCGSFA